MSNDVRSDVEKALNQASVEYITKLMEEVNPKEFKSYSQVGKKRVERNVMYKITGKKEKAITGKKIAAAAAIMAVVAGGVSMVNPTVRAAVFSKFTFIPGQGVTGVEDTQASSEAEDTENAEDTTAEATTAETAANSDIYILSDRRMVNANDDISLRINNATIQNGKLEINYFVELIKIDDEKVMTKNHTIDYYEETPNYYELVDEYMACYNELGFDKYFTFSAEKGQTGNVFDTIKSELTVDGKTCNVISSELVTTDASSFTKVTIKEAYDISDMDPSDINEYVLGVGDFNTSFKMELVKAYNSEDEAIASVGSANALQDSGIRLMTETEWDGDRLKVAVYPISSGIFSEIAGFWSADDPYLEVDGKRIECEWDDDYIGEADIMTRHVVFDMTGISRDAEYVFHAPGVDVIAMCDPIEIQIPKTTNQMKDDKHKMLGLDEVTVKVPEVSSPSESVGKTYHLQATDLEILNVQPMSAEAMEDIMCGGFFYGELENPGDFLSVDYKMTDLDPEKATLIGFKKIEIPQSGAVLDESDILFFECLGERMYIRLGAKYQDITEVRLLDPMIAVTEDFVITLDK